MIFWEKNKTGDIIERGYLYYETIDFTTKEEIIRKRFYTKIRDMFLEGIPNLTLGGYKI